MRKSRRQTLIRLLERVALGLFLLDAALYFTAVRPLGNWAAAEQQRRDLALKRIRDEQALIESLEKAQEGLPGADEQVKSFFRSHVPQRRKGFSRAARFVRRISDLAGLRLADVAYKLDSTRDDPLQRLEIELSVEGSFPNLLQFAHALETASDLVVMRDFSFASAEGGNLALRVGADLYLTP